MLAVSQLSRSPNAFLPFLIFRPFPPISYRASGEESTDFSFLLRDAVTRESGPGSDNLPETIAQRDVHLKPRQRTMLGSVSILRCVLPGIANSCIRPGLRERSG